MIFANEHEHEHSKRLEINAVFSRRLSAQIKGWLTGACRGTTFVWAGGSEGQVGGVAVAYHECRYIQQPDGRFRAVSLDRDISGESDSEWGEQLERCWQRGKERGEEAKDFADLIPPFLAHVTSLR